MSDISELKRLGMSVRAVEAMTGHDRKTIRKYLGKEPGTAPTYSPRARRPSKLEGYKPYLDERLQVGVWNAVVLLRELRERGYGGSYTILTDYLRPQREAARQVAVRRFETAPGVQAQVDWGHLGYLEDRSGEQALSGFTFTLGYIRSKPKAMTMMSFCLGNRPIALEWLTEDLPPRTIADALIPVNRRRSKKY